MSTCTAPDCEQPEHAQGLCWGHYRRKLRGADVSTPLRPYRKPSTVAWEAALEAANADTGADADDVYERAKDRFRKAVKRMALEIIRAEGYRKK